MKQLHLLLALCFIIPGCKQQPRPNQQTPENTPSETHSACDYQVNTKVAYDMIKAFEAGLGSNQQIKREFWIESCVILSLSKELDKPENHLDGVRFFSGFNGKTTTLYAVLTTAAVRPTKYYQHTNRWDLSFNAGCQASEIFINKTEEEANREITAFSRDLRGETDMNRTSATKPDLSAAIWVNKCVLKKLATTISKSGGKLDGIKLITASYFKGNPPRQDLESISLTQSTFILIPTLSPEHTPDWDIIDSKGIRDDPFNHSQLCPRICN